MAYSAGWFDSTAIPMAASSFVPSLPIMMVANAPCENSKQFVNQIGTTRRARAPNSVQYENCSSSTVFLSKSGLRSSSWFEQGRAISSRSIDSEVYRDKERLSCVQWRLAAKRVRTVNGKSGGAAAVWVVESKLYIAISMSERLTRCLRASLSAFCGSFNAGMT